MKNIKLNLDFTDLKNKDNLHDILLENRNVYTQIFLTWQSKMSSLGIFSKLK